MKMKKTLALILALSLVMSFFGAFELTASAAETTSLSDIQVLTLAKSKTPVFDSMNPKPSAASDTALSAAWSDWKGGSGNQQDSYGNYINVAGGVDNPRIQMYRGDSSGGSANNASTVDNPDFGQDCDYLLFGFTAEMTAVWGDVALMDIDGDYITAFRYGTDGLNPFYGHSGWGSPHSGKLTPLTMDNENTIPLVTNDTKIEILCRKLDDTQYKVVYFVNDEIVNTITYSGMFNGLGSIQMSRGSGNASSRISFLKPYIFVGNYTEESEYKIVYEGTDEPDSTVLTCEGMDEGYNGEKIFPNVEIPYIDGYVFREKTVDEASQTITLTYEPASDSAFFGNVESDTPFVSLNMLGAHDAFTAKIDGMKGDAAGIAHGDAGSTAGASAGTAAKDASRAQTRDAYELLESGARYFDIRLSRSSRENSAKHTSNVFYTTHGVLSEEFRPVLSTITQWAEAHPGEIIVLDFQEIWDYTETRRGDSTAQTWKDLDKLLDESGIKEFVTINNSTALNNVTYGSLTEDGTKAGVVLFGRFVATNAGVGDFILRGDTNGKFNGKVYSNYEPTDGTKIGAGAFSEDYVNAQVDELWANNSHMKDMFRVMQAQSEQEKWLGIIPTGDDLITNAAKDNPQTYEALLANTNWLSVLPVIMVNDVGTSTDEIVALLKECNVERDVTVECATDSGESFTATKKAMIGTLFPYSVKYGYINKDDKRYYVTSETQTIPTPYGGEPIKVEVEEFTGKVFTLTNDGRIGSFKSDNTGVEQDENCLKTGDNTDTGLNSFLAFNWSGEGTYDRIGAAILDVPKEGSILTLKAERYRNGGNGSNPVTTLTIWALSLDDFQKMNNAADLYKSITPENTLASTSNMEESGKITNEITLDAEKLRTIAGESGTAVILGTATGGLYGLSRDIHIEEAFKVTVDGKENYVKPGENTFDATAIAYSDAEGKIYRPKDGKLTLDVHSDMTLTALTLGVDLLDGAQVRIGQSYGGNIAADSGLRFIGQVDKKDTLAGMEGAKISVKITAAGDEENSVVIDIDNYQDGDDHKNGTVFTAVLTNIKKTNYNRVFTATPVVTVGGETFEGEKGVSRSIFEVASGILVSMKVETDVPVPDSKYEIDEVVKDVLNAYVNAVGVRFGWDRKAGDLTGDPTDYYKYGKDGEHKAFFEVSATKAGDGAYTITLKPLGNAEINEKTLENTLRVNNNHTTAIKYVDKITKNEDGSVTFIFTPPAE